MELSEIIADIFDLNQGEQHDEVIFSSLEEWDSMNHMLFITKVEENFAVELSGDEIAGIKSIGDLKKVLSHKNIQV